MRRILPAVAGTAALVLALTACGSDDSDPDTTPPDEETSSADPADLTAELTWWDTSDPTNEGPAFKELIAKFNETYPNVKINYQSVPFGETPRTSSRRPPKSDSGAPDILRAEVAWVPEFASLGYLYALDGTRAAGRQRLPRDAAVVSNVTTARPTASRRSPTRSA